jgi:glycosyltransferase involved in cell wall biosynthesis
MNIVARQAAAAETESSTKELPAAGLRTQRRVLMLLGNAFDPDVRVHTEARSLVAAGYRVTIFAWDRDAKAPCHERVDGIEVERLRVRSTHGRGITQTWFAARVTAAMIVRALRCHIDIVHAHDMDMLPAAYVISRLKRTPLVYDSHEDYAGMLQGSVPGWFANAIRALETMLARRADLLITVGDILRGQFEARGCKRTVVVGNWKRLAEYEASPGIHDEVRSQLAIPRNAIVIAYIAQLGRDRKIVELLEAIRRRPQVHLIVGGAGVQRQAVVDAAAASPNVHYLGIVKPGDVAKYTIAADAVYYGFDVTNPNARYSAPNKLFEALAAGRCLISGRFGEIQHIVAKYDCGVLVEEFSVEELVRALDECSDRDRLERWNSNAARAGKEQYSWERAEATLLAMYAALIGEPRRDERARSHAALSKGRDR